MKEITISEKNFKRFAKRYQKLHDVGLMDAQEQLSQVLGCSNYHELNRNFQQSPYSYPQYNNFLFELKSCIESYASSDYKLYYFDFKKDNIEFICHKIAYTEDVFHHENSKISLFLDSNNFDHSKIDEKIKDILKKHLSDKDLKQWNKGLIDFLESLPQSITVPAVFILYAPLKFKRNNKIIISLVRSEEFEKDSEGNDTLNTHYDLDYFSGEKSNIFYQKYHSSINELTGYEVLEEMEEAIEWQENMIVGEDAYLASTSDEDLILIEDHDGELDIDEINNSEEV